MAELEPIAPRPSSKEHNLDLFRRLAEMLREHKAAKVEIAEIRAKDKHCARTHLRIAMRKHGLTVQTHIEGGTHFIVSVLEGPANV